MGQQQSKDELLYEAAIDGKIEAIKSLCSEGAGLEWIGKDGKTPLIVACMDPERYILTKTLIELGANVNAYRPGLHAGTPLHHAAKRGLDHTVRLLLSHGANPLVRNDECQSPLDVARSRGFANVVHAIESHICFFSGWLREYYGPGFLEAFAPQLLSRKIWVVIIPCRPHNPAKPLKLELVIYSTLQDARPRTVIALWNADIEEPKFDQSDPTLIIVDKSSKTRYKFAPASDRNKQQILLLYNACRGIRQVMTSPALPDTQPSTTASQTAAEAAELAMAINASRQSALVDRLSLQLDNHPSSEGNSLNGWGDTTNATSQNGWGSSSGGPTPPDASSSGWADGPTNEEYNNCGDTTNATSQNGWGSFGGSPTPEASSGGWADGPTNEEYNGWGVPEPRPSNNSIQAQTTNAIPVLVSSVLPPSAPPVSEEDLYEGPIHYPSVDFSPVDLRIPSVENKVSKTSEAKDGDGSCVICWEAPVEGACIPCGHMAGCMSCLNEIKTKKGDCPVCRAKINQVIRLYAV
ncbi:E3 ubiquitin-protein like [Actinidia chinensis var. chinensis]|uniref:E3 ubiquitin-protein like n=1 Tax=Actinidia chinensis var. chinensis TaxID=1590841 RepID=A0A2R6PP78_ACTCC|nr:E3 ubiquitin-protein like [Actinidia chinensis var. chinensis]